MLKRNLSYIMLLFVLFLPEKSNAQQLPQFTQYLYNTISINPAYAGTRERLTIGLLNRNQWVGVNGAPVTQTLTVDSSLPDTNLGAGLSLIHDKLGYERTTFLYADVSYTVYMNKDYRLSFGFKAGLSKYGLDSDLLTDPSAIGDQYLDRIFNRWKPNFGAGVYYRSDDWFMSFSAPRILSYNNRTDIEYAAIERVSYYLSGGYMLDFNLHLKFKPTFLVKFTNGAPPSVDLTGNFLIKDTLWLGLSYRVGDALGGLATIEANKNLKFGYAYEFNTTALNPYTSGSHEIFMIYSFDYPRTKCDCENKF